MLCQPTFPSSPCGIAIVGEAPGEQEEKVGIPFIGPAGQELTKMLSEAGIDRSSCFITNVFNERPPENDLYRWCVGALEAKKLNGGKYPWTPLSRGKYIVPERMSSLARLTQELNSFKPKLVLALGNTALWALTGNGGISNVRGVVQPLSTIGNCKLLPTFHPSYILKQWSDRPIVIADLIKAKRELGFPEIRRPSREIYIEPSLADLEDWEREILRATVLSVDIETRKGQITCIGFSPSRSKAFVVPFIDPAQKDFSYWRSLEDEVKALLFVKRWLQSPIPKLFQNGMYDIQWIWKKWGFSITNCLYDTMLKHHAIQPEMPKGLGFLGSLYTQEASWKLMRNEATDTIKRDE